MEYSTFALLQVMVKPNVAWKQRIGEYGSKVLAHVQKNAHRMVYRPNEYGSSIIRGHINENGTLKRTAIVEPSHNPRFDSKVSQLITLAAPFEPIPIELLQRKFSDAKRFGVSLVLKFSRLQGSAVDNNIVLENLVRKQY